VQRRRAQSIGGDQVLFDLLPAPAYIFDDRTLQFLAVNTAALVRYGYTRAEFLQLTLLDIRPAEDRKTVRESVARDAEILRYRAVLRHMTSENDVFYVEVISQPIVYENRHAHYVVATDVTEHLDIQRALSESRARLETQLEARRSAEHELRELNRRLRTVSARARATREEDRTRMARELHDQLGQGLAALKMDLHWLRNHLWQATPDQANEKNASMASLVDDLIFRVRRLSSELRPALLDRLGLIAAVEWQLGEFRRRWGLRTRLDSRHDHVKLDSGRSTAVFRIVQEALTNIAQHAAASSVHVKVATPDGTLVVAVADDGRGIPANVIESETSIGLQGMRERAALLGGQVEIASRKPKGTLVTVTVPLEERRRSPRGES
jgi:PAS domain S-box-containing protein